VIDKAELEKIGKSHGFGHKMTCVVEAGTKGKTYRVACANDLRCFEIAEDRLAPMRSGGERHEITIPNEELPYLRSIFNVHVYGINTWAKLFNERQLLTLITLAKTIRRAIAKLTALHDADYAVAVASLLTLTLGRQADYCSTLCRWSPQGEFLADTFCRQALGMMWDHAEGDPFSTTTGNWLGAVDWISRVVEFLATNRMPVGKVSRGDAVHTGYEASSLHAIVTDPPYYDAVPYANLSDFFYVWFRRVLSDRMPDVFRTPLAPKGPEIVQLAERNPAYKHKTKEFFENGMKDAFAEGARILHSNGLFTVVYAYKTTAAWETLVNALIRAGLAVNASWPLHTERPGRMRSHDSASLASSVFLVCRKRQQNAGDGLWDDVRKELQAVAKERLDFFWSQGIRGADFFISAIGPALSVFGRYERVTKLSGEEVTVGQFLDEVRGLVTNYALAKILKTTHTASIDSESRFCVVWKWSYGDAKVPADEAFKLAQALGMNTEIMWDRTGVLEKSGENVQAVPVAKRMKIKNLGEPDSNSAPASLIDVLHRLCVFREKGDTAGMTEFLTRSGQAQNPALWLVAQAVSEILPDGDKEKQLMQGLLNQKEQLAEAQGRLF
jgi:adenine-specific DNA methylase